MVEYLVFAVLAVIYFGVILWAYWRTEKDDRFK